MAFAKVEMAHGIVGRSRETGGVVERVKAFNGDCWRRPYPLGSRSILDMFENMGTLEESEA